MSKLKWHYDSKNKQWYTLETVAWANDGFTIKKVEGKFSNTYYRLEKGYNYVSSFDKLSSAKRVAELISFG